MCKLLSGRYCWAVARQRDSVKMASPGLHSPRSVPWGSRCVPNLKSAAQAKNPGQANRVFLRKTGCVCVGCLCSALGLVVCQELPIVTVLWDPEMHIPLSTGAKWSRGISWMEAIKTGAPDVCNRLPQGDTGTLELGRGRVWRWCSSRQDKKGAHWLLQGRGECKDATHQPLS